MERTKKVLALVPTEVEIVTDRHHCGTACPHLDAAVGSCRLAERLRKEPCLAKVGDEGRYLRGDWCYAAEGVNFSQSDYDTYELPQPEWCRKAEKFESDLHRQWSGSRSVKLAREILAKLNEHIEQMKPHYDDPWAKIHLRSVQTFHGALAYFIARCRNDE